MIKKLSRIFGISGSALALLAFLSAVVKAVYFPDSYAYEEEARPYAFSVIDAIPFLVAAAGLAGSFFIRRKPALAAVLMIASGLLVLPFCFFVLLALPSFAPAWLESIIMFIPTLLLIAAGVLAIIGGRTPGGRAQPMLKKLSFITGVTSAAVSTLTLGIYTAGIISILCSISNEADVQRYIFLYQPYLILSVLFASAVGLFGSLLSRRKPVVGAVLMLLSGIFIFCFGPGLLSLVPSPLLAASAVLVLISRRKAPAGPPQNESTGKAAKD